MPQVALITGASSGFGLEFCRLAAADGYDLVMVARDLSRLEDAAARIRAERNVTVDVISQDLGVPGAAEGVYGEVKRRGRHVDVLVNNAGFGYRGFFAEQNRADLESLLQTNIVALTMLTRLLVPDMLSSSRGHILNVGSTAAFLPGPLMSAYHASKAFVLWFSEALVVELAGSGVTVTALCPGPSKTGFSDRAGTSQRRVMRSPLVIDATRIAQIGYRAMLAGKRVVVPGFLNALGAFLSFHSPRSVTARATMRLYEG